MIILALLLALLPSGWQDGESRPAKPPQKGDTVVVKGCINGGVIESTGIAKSDETEHLTELLAYRLTGDKKVVGPIKKDHDGHVDVVTAELRTDLPTSRSGVRAGNSRIAIGVGASRGMLPEPPPPMPVLKVSSIEHTGVRCR